MGFFTDFLHHISFLIWGMRAKITVISPGRDKYVSIKTGHYINGKLVFPHHKDYEFAVGDVLEYSLPQGKCAPSQSR